MWSEVPTACFRATASAVRARSLYIAAIDPPFSLTRNWQALQPQPASTKCQLHDSDKNIATTINTPQQKTKYFGRAQKNIPLCKNMGALLTNIEERPGVPPEEYIKPGGIIQ